ncbi:MAG: pantetheine-phosphate adenylyltransferase [Chloroflexi bacterium RBG_16_51_9]|nr:MAG: pantetheine-phosphate adenylyltransferase [Chloroflexi bacterium RBG_16_51_9]
MTIALYPGSFDPITNGHLDIAIRAARLFEKLIIGVYDIPAKTLLFNTEERVALVRESIAEANLTNVSAEPFYGLVVNYAKEIGAQTIVRGLRMGGDFEREFEMELMNKHLAPDCELVCLIANPKYQFVSSSLLKEVASLNAYIDDIVPKPVARALKKKLLAKV